MDSPFELLRQWVGQGGWYDGRARAFNQLVGVQFIVAMTLRRGEPMRLPSRVRKLMHTIYMDHIQPETVIGIFTTLVEAAADEGSFSILSRVLLHSHFVNRTGTATQARDQADHHCNRRHIADCHLSSTTDSSYSSLCFWDC